MFDTIKPGYRTSEFWITVVVNLAAAVLAVVAHYGLLTDDESALWLALVRAAAAIAAPLVMAIVSREYIRGRTQVKSRG
jgi:hypothetical protein